jgi:hypothetical protein
MHHDPKARSFRTDVDYGPGWRQERRDSVNDDVAPDDVSLLGPPTRWSARSNDDLGAYGYAGQGYPIYGQARGERPYDDPEPGWFADPASSAYAFGYTTSMRSNYPFTSSGYGGHSGKGPKDYVRADARVLEDVCERLSEDDEVDASDIFVSVRNGEVTLEGTVIDRYTRRRAELVAATVRGVVDVHDRLRVQKGLLRELGDKLAGEGTDEHHGHSGEGPHIAPNTPNAP